MVYKTCKNAGIPLTKGADVTLEAKNNHCCIYFIFGHFRAISIANMGPPPSQIEGGDPRPKVAQGPSADYIEQKL